MAATNAPIPVLVCLVPAQPVGVPLLQTGAVRPTGSPCTVATCSLAPEVVVELVKPGAAASRPLRVACTYSRSMADEPIAFHRVEYRLQEIPLIANACHSGNVRRKLIAVWLLVVAAVGASDLLRAQTARPIVYVVPIDGVIDLGLAPFLARTIGEAE